MRRAPSRAVRSTGAKRTPEQPDPARLGRKAGTRGHAQKIFNTLCAWSGVFWDIKVQLQSFFVKLGI
ncbi:hypothetical protein JCM30197_19000 [Schleiferia thermophila]|nr:hypothetical protein JCM30197_19000 [Schleiferia thermophila]